MERHEISTDKIDWPNLVRHVVRDRVVVELAEGELPVAMLVPIERPKTMADLDKALRQIPRLGEEATCFEADIHAKIVASLSLNGTMIGPHDNWIAATALKYDYDLLTTNVAEFSRVPHLRVIDYPNSS